MYEVKWKTPAASILLAGVILWFANQLCLRSEKKSSGNRFFVAESSVSTRPLSRSTSVGDSNINPTVHDDSGIDEAERLELVWPICYGLPSWVEGELRSPDGQVIVFASVGRVHPKVFHYKGRVSSPNWGHFEINLDESLCEVSVISEPFGIYGQAVFENGEPAPMAQIHGCGNQTLSDANGDFFMLSSMDEECEIRAVYENGRSRNEGQSYGVTPPLDGNDVNIVITAPDYPVKWEGSCTEAKKQANLIPVFLEQNPDIEIVTFERLTMKYESLPDCAFE